VLRLGGPEHRRLEDVARVTAGGGSARIEPEGDELPRTTRLIPDWAEIEQTEPDRHREWRRSTTVRWKERGIEVRFDGSPLDTAIGPTLLAAPRPGRVLVLAHAEGRLELRDLASGEVRHVLEGLGDGPCRMRPSPDGSTVLLRTQDVTHVLDASDGRPLRAPIPRDEGRAEWVHTGGSHRVLALSSKAGELVVDLDTGREFALERDRGHLLLVRVADRGYAYVDRAGDLVLADLDGKRIRVLIDR
jgi:hypothetical protein